MDTLRIVHLTTGEDIIGKTQFDVNENVYVITDPVSPHMAMDPASGSVRVGLMPIRPFVDESLREVKISSLHVAYVAEIAEQMRNAYTQYTSDIQIADGATLSSLLKG